MWVIPELTPEFIERMEDVLDQYKKPLNTEEPTVCLDERPVQLLAEVKSPIQANEPGKIKKRDSEYVRCGKANIFCAVEPKAGNHITKVTTRRTAADFAKFMKEISDHYPKATKIHLVMDNLNIHCMKSCIEYYGADKGEKLWNRFEVHYTPKHGSWLNQAEIEISLLSREALGKERFHNLWSLQLRVNAWNKRSNEEQRTIQWKFTSSKARKKFKYDLKPKLDK